ncbi:MAG: penicillin-binding transpeptidase domain-containing protein [Micrococcales bacterium]|nr:penicillin-binding transpeptidase domain-containing protein [Micrococcales bacterium]
MQRAPGTHSPRTGRGAHARRTALGAVGVVLLITGYLTGCSHTADPAPAADKLAKALASGTLSDAQWADEAPPDTAWTEVFDQLDAHPTVSVAKAVRTQNTTAVTFQWDWQLGVPAVTWSYTTSGTLTLVNGHWAARWSPNLLVPSLRPGEHLVVTRTQAPRGRVLGAGGQVLVEPRAVVRIGIDKALLDPDDQEAAARALATALGMDADAYASRVKAAGTKQFVEAIMVRPDDPRYHIHTLAAMDGVALVDDTVPLAPYGDFARPVLGKVDVATAELIDASGGAIVAGDTTGRSGLQRQYDELLRGTPGWDVRAVTSGSDVRRQVFHADPVPGEDLHTTIDQAMQQAAETLLERQEPASAIVAIRPSTGDILAVASGPGSGGFSTATVGQYAPGSTFKIVSALALLRAGYTPDQTVTCPESVTVAGKRFRNVPGYPPSATGSVSFTTAFANSCNTVFVSAADKVTDADLAVAARSLGLDPASGAGFGAFLGSVPDETDATGHAAAMIGQGKVLASPLGMATVMASVAAGTTVTPRIVVDAPPPPSTPTPTVTGPALRPLTNAEVAALRTLMHAVVTDGTAAKVLASVMSDDLLAKTGTAEFDSDGTMVNRTWIVASTGDLAVVAFVEVGDHGATTPGPLLAELLRSFAS